MGLVVAGGVRIRDQHGGHTDGGQLRDGRRTGPAHDQIGGRVGQVHPVEIRHGTGVRRQPPLGLLQGRRPGLDQQMDVGAGGPAVGEPDRGLGEPGGAQAAAVDQDEPGAVGHPQRAAGRVAQRAAVEPGQGRGDRHPGGDRAGQMAGVEGDRDMRGEPGGELVGPAGHRIGFMDQARQPGQPRPDDHRRARVAAHADGHLGALVLEDGPALGARTQQRGRQQIAPGAERRIEGDHVDGVQPVTGLRYQPGLQAPFGPDERDHRIGHRATQRVGEGEPRVDVAAGAARTDHDGEWCAHGRHAREVP